MFSGAIKWEHWLEMVKKDSEYLTSFCGICVFASQDNEDSGKLKTPVHYLDDMEDIVDDTEDMVDEDLDEYPDHEPIYQPADQEEAYGKKFLLIRVCIEKSVE